MDIVTYNGLFEWVDLPSYVAAQFLIDDPEHHEVFCEPVSPILVRCYYPIESWIKELKRREEIEQINTLQKQMKVIKFVSKPLEQDIKKLIISATLAGNFAEVQRLGELLNSNK